jgi:hypothetical protein
MVVSLLRVIYTGLQDERLLPPKGKPTLSFFTKVFIKAGRFTTSWVRLDFDTRPNFGTQASITLPRQGHLITRLYLVSTLPDIAGPQLLARAAAGASFVGPTFGWTNSLGHALIANATIDIGGARVETLNGQLMEILDEFNTPLEKTTIVNTLLPRIQNGFKPTSIGWDERPTVAVTPLPFWFSRGDPGVVLPIDAIGVDQVRINITFVPVSSAYVSSAQLDIGGQTTLVPGQAYFPLLGSPFYQTGGANPKPVFGLNGNPTQAQTVSIIPGITMPTTLSLGDTYMMAEYVYLDKPEANRFRISDIQYPIPQHYLFEPTDTNGLPRINIPLRIPNPTRDLFFYAQRFEAPAYNAPFLATRDLSGLGVTVAPWWPDASGLNAVNLGYLVPGFSTRQSEPLQSVALVYEGKLFRYANLSPSIFRSLLPSYEQKKAPWINRYYYNMSFGVQHGLYPPSVPLGEANLDKVEKLELRLQFNPFRGSIDPNCVPRYTIYCFAETYNILRIYGGKAGLLFQF